MTCLQLLLIALLTPPSGGDPLPGFTAPYRAVTLSAELTGTVVRLPHREGAAVSADVELIGLKTSVQRVRTDLAGLKSDSDVEVRAAEVRLERAEAEAVRLEGLGGDALASVKELADARAEARGAELALELARQAREIACLELELQQALLERHSIAAPFEGYVAARLVEVGQTVEAGEPMLELVQVDPLLVVIDCPLERARELRPGQRIDVTDALARDDTRSGEVVFVAPVADAASQTVRIKVRVANADGAWLAGMKTWVHVPLAPVEPATALTSGRKEH